MDGLHFILAKNGLFVSIRLRFSGLARGIGAPSSQFPPTPGGGGGGGGPLSPPKIAPVTECPMILPIVSV